MVDLTLDAFRKSGLPLDWQSVYVAWTNAPDVSGGFSVSDDDVKSLALDALAVCLPTDENALFRIADDASVHGDDIKRFAGEFAERSGVSETDALRRWRIIYLSGLLKVLTEWNAKARLKGDNFSWDVAGETIWDIAFYMEPWNVGPEPPSIWDAAPDVFAQNLAALDAWLADEKAELLQIPTPTVASLPTPLPPAQ